MASVVKRPATVSIAAWPCPLMTTMRESGSASLKMAGLFPARGRSVVSGGAELSPPRRFFLYARRST